MCSNFWFFISRIKTPQNVKSKERSDKGSITLWMRFQCLLRSYVKRLTGSTKGTTNGQSDTTSGQTGTTNEQTSPMSELTSATSGQTSAMNG